MKIIQRVVFFLLALLVAVPSHAGMFGPPGTSENRDGWVVGAGYFSAEKRMKSDSRSVAARQAQAFGEISFPEHSISEEGETFLRVGMSNFDDGKGFEDGYKLFGTLGMRDLWYSLESARYAFGIGTIGQASYFSEAKSNNGVTQGVVKNFWCASLAVALRYEATRTLTIYGGPFFEYGSANVSLDNGGATTSETLKLKDGFGGMAGVRIALPKRFLLNVEGQAGGGTSLGAALAYSF